MNKPSVLSQTQKESLKLKNLKNKWIFWGSICLVWLLQVFSTTTDLFKCVSSLYQICLILALPEISRRTFKKWLSSVRGFFVLRSSPRKGNKWNCLHYLLRTSPERPKIFLFRENANSYKSEKETPTSKETWSFSLYINYFMYICCVFLAFSPAVPGRGCLQTWENSRGEIRHSRNLWIHWYTNSPLWSNQWAHSISFEITQDTPSESCQAGAEVSTAATTLHNDLTLENKHQCPCCL